MNYLMPLIFIHFIVLMFCIFRGGQDIRGALIGPGVAASHGMERSHVDAVENTMKLLIAYMTKKD